MNFNLHFGELHSDNSINDKNNLFENYIPKCDKVKRILTPSIVFLSIFQQTGDLITKDDVRNLLIVWTVHISKQIYRYIYTMSSLLK